MIMQSCLFWHGNRLQPSCCQNSWTGTCGEWAALFYRKAASTLTISTVMIIRRRRATCMDSGNGSPDAVQLVSAGGLRVEDPLFPLRLDLDLASSRLPLSHLNLFSS